MVSILPNNPRHLPLQILDSSVKNRVNKVKWPGYSGIEIPSGGTFSAQPQQLISNHKRSSNTRLVSVRAVSGEAESNSGEDDGENKNKEEKASGGISREDLERLVGADDSTFSGIDLATLIRKKYGRSYDVQLIKKEFMGRNLLAMNVMWKYMEQKSFPLTEEEYLLRLDDVANNLKCWGAVSHIRNSLARLRERPRIGKAVCIFIDMDESGARSNEWIYK